MTNNKSRHHPITVEAKLDVPCHVAWLAITSHEQMVCWFFDNIPAFNPEVGFTTRFAVQSGPRTFTHNWEITAVVPRQKIVFSWRYSEYAGEGTVTFELIPAKGGCRIRLTNEGLDTFPDSIPEFSRESCASGWDWFINQRLVEYLRNLDVK